MKFYPQPMIRYFAKYTAVLLFVVSPLVVLINAILSVSPADRLYVLGVAFCYLIGSWILFYFSLLEKLCATIKIANNMIWWRCPLKPTKSIPIDECKYFGVQLEDSYNRLPYPFIYISKFPYPKEYEGKINKLKNSNEFIKFWYSDELCGYLIRKFPSNRTGPLQYYQWQCKKIQKR